MTDDVWAHGQWKSDRLGWGYIPEKSKKEGIGISIRAISLVLLAMSCVM